MKKMTRSMLSLLLVLLLSFSLGAAAFADETDLGSSAPANATTDAGPNNGEDTGIISADTLNAWVEDYIDEHNLNGSNQVVSVGFYYSGTGDSWYYDADQWMYSASLYKVPVSMLMAQKEAAGEITQDTIIDGMTFAQLESTALIYSNNDSGHSMMGYLGSDNSGKCSELTKALIDLPDSYYDEDFYSYSYYSARYMTKIMQTLYEGGDAKFPHVMEYLLQANPGEYFRKTLDGSYDVAQKYGAYTERNSTQNNHCSAVIYTPHPIVVTVMLKNVNDYQTIISDIGGKLVNYALELDGKLDAWNAQQAAMAAKAAEEEAAAQAAAEEAARAAAEASENPVQPDNVSSANTAADSGSTAAQTAKADTGKARSTLRLIIAMVIVAVIIILIAALIGFLRANSERKRRSGKSAKRRPTRYKDEFEDWEEEAPAPVKKSRPVQKNYDAAPAEEESAYADELDFPEYTGRGSNRRVTRAQQNTSAPARYRATAQPAEPEYASEPSYEQAEEAAPVDYYRKAQAAEAEAAQDTAPAGSHARSAESRSTVRTPTYRSRSGSASANNGYKPKH